MEFLYSDYSKENEGNQMGQCPTCGSWQPNFEHGLLTRCIHCGEDIAVFGNSLYVGEDALASNATRNKKRVPPHLNGKARAQLILLAEEDATIKRDLRNALGNAKRITDLIDKWL